MEEANAVFLLGIYRSNLNFSCYMYCNKGEKVEVVEKGVSTQGLAIS